MLTKNNIKLMTIFSLMLVIIAYYLFFNKNTLTVNDIIDNKEDAKVTIKESSSLTALRINHDEAMQEEMNKVKDILNDEKKTSSEKNEAYEALKAIKNSIGLEKNIEDKIKKEFKYNSFVNIDGNKVKITIDSKEHNYSIANKIINVVSKSFEEKKYISVTFSNS
jgi:preprotein translocase subunit SecF